MITGTFLKLKKTKILSNFVNLSSIQLSNALLMILLYPIITRIVGLEAFGMIMVTNAFAGICGILVNYGTIQTSIKEVSILKDKKENLSGIVVNTYAIRLTLFIVVALLLVLSSFFISNNYLFYLLTLPLIFAEVLNPMFFFVGVQNLRVFNASNLISKITTVLLIVIFIKGAEEAIWVNFLMGSILSLTYILLIFYAARKYVLQFIWPSHLSQMLILKGNFYLFINNIAVHLQQSLMLFALQKWGTAELLGAYSLGDKVIWSSRLLLMSISNAVYPSSARLFHNNPQLWPNFKRKIKLSVGSIFLLGSIVLFASPELIVKILTGEANANAVLFLRQMAFVPFISALNLMNVLDRLLHNDHYTIFKIAVIILVVSAITSYSMVTISNINIIGYYVLVTELNGLLLYEYFIRRNRLNA